MSNTAALIPAIQAELGKEKAARVISRMIRLPALWQAAIIPSVFNPLIESGDFSPINIVDLSQRYGDQTEITARVSQLNQQSIQMANALSRGESFDWESFSPEQIELIITLALARNNADEFLHVLLQSGHDQVRRAALQADLTLREFENNNRSLGNTLTTSEQEQLWLDIFHTGERQAVKIISNDGSLDSDSEICAAIQLWAEGEEEKAQQNMEAAWDQITDGAAVIADAIARLASYTEEPLLEAEAHQRALQLRPSATRRANLANARLAVEDAQGAFQVLDKDPAEPIEKIALGMVHATMGQNQQAKDQFQSVIVENMPPHPEWEARLLKGWIDLGETGKAVDLLETILARHPSNLPLRRMAAEIEWQAGNSGAVINHAVILNSIDPEDHEAKLLLADAYHAGDRSEDALAIWIELADTYREAKQKAVEAALATGEIGAALSFAQDLVESDPQSASARLALGKSLVKAGNQQGGMVHLRRATELEPSSPGTWLALADVQMSEGSSEASGQTLAEAIQACPDNPKLLSARAAWLEAQDRTTEALEVCRQACSVDESNPTLMIQQAKLLVELERSDEAQPLLEEAIRQQPANWKARIELASIYEENKQAEGALELLQDLPQESTPDAYGLLARVLIKANPETESGDKTGEKAIQAIRQAKALGADSPEFEYWRARALQLMDRHEEALQTFQACAKSLPEHSSDLKLACQHGQAKSAMASDQVPVAISLLERARQEGNIQADSLALLSKAYLSAGLASEAMEPAIEACQLEPTDQEVREQYLEAAKANGQIEGALHELDHWIEDTPNAEGLLFHKAVLHSELKQTRKARETLAQLAWQNRRDPAKLDHIGKQLLSINESESAVRLLQHADYQNPGRIDRLVALAQAAVLAGQHRTAEDAWKKVVELEPENVQALLGAAEACWQLDQRVSAIGYWQRAIGIKPGRADLHARVARAQLTNGEKNQALDHFRTAAELAPTNGEILLEAAQALMATHNYSEALALLQSESIEDEMDRVERFGMMAQIFLGLGRPEEALASIQRYDGDQANAKLSALASLAYTQTTAVEQAHRHLQKALANDVRTLDEATWVARSALELGQWQDGLDVTRKKFIRDSKTKHALHLQLAVTSRIADAYRLLASFGSAYNHAPDVQIISESMFHELSDRLAELSQYGCPQSEIHAWRARLEAAFGREKVSTAPDVNSLPSDHVIRQQAIEGLALAQIEAGDPDGALRTIASAPETLQAGPWSALLAGISHLKADRPAMARKALGAVEKGSPFWPLAAFLVGKCWQREERPEEAINSWNAAVLAWPSETYWQSQLALIYREQGKPEAALPHLQTALEAAPEEHDLRLPLARTLFELGDLEGAAQHYQQLRKEFDQDPEVLTEIAQALLATGESTNAYELFKSALDISPKLVEAEVGAAQAAWQIGDHRLAEKHSAKAMRHNPREPQLLVSLAELLIASNSGKQALAMLDEAYGQTQPPASVARVKARVLFKLGKAQESIQLLRKVIEDDPEDDKAWFALAQSHASANQAGQAIDALRLALNLRPGYKPYRMKLARLFRETGQLDQALDELSDLQNEDPIDHNIPLEIGLVHRARRQLRQALAAFQHSIELKADSASAYFQAGMVLKALKAYPQAVDMLERATAINPNDSEAMHQLAAVQALQLVHGGIQATAVSQ